MGDNEWGSIKYPFVPGHEMTGIVTKVGSNVKKFKVGDRVGAGAMAATCLDCELCTSSKENYCEKLELIIGGTFWDGTVMQGGFSKLIVYDQRYIVHVPESLPMDAASPLLCAGITVFTPMKYNHLFETTGRKVGVVGLGGLGHVAVKFAKAFGHHVTIISTSPSKEKEARVRLGADDFLLSTDANQMQAKKRSLDVIIDTTAVARDLGATLELLKVDGTLCIVGIPGEPYELPAIPLTFGKKNIQGSLIGSIEETQEMMDICGKHNITCDIELVKPGQINEAFDRILRNDIKYRFVIDIAEET
ncbi:putative cinnamyl alcohol dehydrogenase 6 [Turnera subulata]|uniref:Cinnamyl alcohol dehydrogenase 6 n=1 Tax=Turnera subulata TaxID=218843 RepID=A0A9Q0J4J0_9ROSI|nr:putative cinnamyl alcohol dehydrogenase 6 [Turnera subulata]